MANLISIVTTVSDILCRILGRTSNKCIYKPLAHLFVLPGHLLLLIMVCIQHGEVYLLKFHVKFQQSFKVLSKVSIYISISKQYQGHGPPLILYLAGVK